MVARRQLGGPFKHHSIFIFGRGKTKICRTGSRPRFTALFVSTSLSVIQYIDLQVLLFVPPDLWSARHPKTIRNQSTSTAKATATSGVTSSRKCAGLRRCFDLGWKVNLQICLKFSRMKNWTMHSHMRKLRTFVICPLFSCICHRQKVFLLETKVHKGNAVCTVTCISVLCLWVETLNM